MRAPQLGGEDPPAEGNGDPLQDSCLENPVDRAALAGYSPWGGKRVRHDLVTKQQGVIKSRREESDQEKGQRCLKKKKSLK